MVKAYISKWNQRANIMKSTFCNPHVCKKGLYEYFIQSYENLDSCEIDDDTTTPIQKVEKDFLNAKE